MENQDIQAKIEAALNSLEGIQSAVADPLLLQKIEARIQANRVQRQIEAAKVRSIAFRLAIAAGIMLVLNCTVWLSVGIRQEHYQTVQQFAEIYFGTPLNY